jgi:hypothetical protein
MSPDRPCRLKDIKFQDEGDKRRGVIGPVAVIESGGRYSVTMESHNLRLAWHDLEEKTADFAINAALNALLPANQPRRVGDANAPVA